MLRSTVVLVRRPPWRSRAVLTSILCCGLLTVATTPAHAAERGFELVTPPGGLNHTAQGLAAQPDGHGFYWRGVGGEQTADPAANDGALGDVFLAHRAAQEWATTWLTPNPEGRVAAETSIGLPGMRADGFVFTTTGAWSIEGAEDYPRALFRGDGAASTLLSAAPWTAEQAGLNDSQWTVSEDLSSTVFATTARLHPDDTDSAEDLYLRRGDELLLLSRRSDGTAENSTTKPFLPEAYAGNKAGTFADGTLAFSSQSRSGFPVSQGAAPVSPDGRAVVFSTTAQLDPADTDTRADLYLWREGHGVRLLSDDERSARGCPGVTGSTTDCTAATADVSFVGMSEDASIVYLRSREGLVDDDTDGGNDIYRYRVDAPAGQRLTRATGPAVSNAVWPVSVTPLGQLFFAATDRLGVDPPTGTAPVLYRWDGTTIVTVTTLAENDIFQGAALRAYGIASGTPAQRAVRATAHGSALLFRTVGALDPADTDGADDLYLWRAGKGVTRVSGDGPSPIFVGSDGSGPTGATFLGRGGGRATNADASRVFFASPDVLTADAGDNGRPKLYEWRDGTGISLLSPPGAHAGGVTYVDNDVTGDNVFFMTEDALVSADTDGGAIDTYVARIGGGFAEPTLAEPCAGDACQGGPRPRPVAPPVGSVGFAGAGDASPPPLASGKPKVRAPKMVRGTRATLRVTVPGPGRVRTSGSGLTRTSRTATKAGRYTARVRLTTRARATLKRKRRLTKSVRVSFAPRGQKTHTQTVRVTFATAKKTTKKGR
jgi:hypothetical protein